MKASEVASRSSCRNCGVFTTTVAVVIALVLAFGCMPPSPPPAEGPSDPGGGSGGGSGVATVTVQNVEFYVISGTGTNSAPRFLRNDTLFSNGLILRYYEPTGTAELIGIQSDEFRRLARHDSTIFSPKASYAFALDVDRFIVYRVTESGLQQLGELAPEFLFFSGRRRMPIADDGQTVLATNFRSIARVTPTGIQFEPFGFQPDPGAAFVGINTEMWFSERKYFTDQNQKRSQLKLFVTHNTGFEEKFSTDVEGHHHSDVIMTGQKLARSFNFLFSKDGGISLNNAPSEFYYGSEHFIPIQRSGREFWITHLSKDAGGSHLFHQQLRFIVADPIDLATQTVHVVDRLNVPVAIDTIRTNALVPTGYTNLAHFSLGTDKHLVLMDWERERLVSKFLFNSVEGLDVTVASGPGAVFAANGKYYAARHLFMEIQKNGTVQTFKYIGPFGYGAYEKTSGKIWIAQTHCDRTKVVGFYNPTTGETKVATRLDTEFEVQTEMGRPRSPDIVHAIGVTDKHLALVHGEKVDYAGYKSYLVPVVELYSKSDLSFVRKFDFRNGEAGFPAFDRLNSFSTSRNGLIAISSRSTRYTGYPRTVVFNEKGEVVAEIEGIGIQNSYYKAWNSDLSEDGNYVAVVAGLTDKKDAVLLFELDVNKDREVILIPGEFTRIGVKGAKLVKSIVVEYNVPLVSRCDSRMPFSKTTLLEGNRFVIFTSTPYWSNQRTAFVADFETNRVISLADLDGTLSVSSELIYANHDRYGNLVLVHRHPDGTVRAMVAKLSVR